MFYAADIPAADDARFVDLATVPWGDVTFGAEGNDTAEWVLVDFGDVIVHIMLPSTREFYDLESLWTLKPA